MNRHVARRAAHAVKGLWRSVWLGIGLGLGIGGSAAAAAEAGAGNAPALAFDQARGDYVLRLQPGWNLVSLPVRQTRDGTLPAPAAGLTAPLWAFDSHAGNYRAKAELAPLEGAWIYASVARELRIPGTVLDAAELVLKPGWNLAGPAAPMTVPAGAGILKTAWGWDVVNRSLLDPKGWLEPGHGYWLYALTPVALRLGDAREDTDGDLLLDVWEASHGCDYLNPDTDGDSLSDFAEVMICRTRADAADSDGDGLPDAWEVANHLEPLSPGDAGADADGDGLDNAAEYREDLDPRRRDAEFAPQARVTFSQAGTRARRDGGAVTVELRVAGTVLLRDTVAATVTVRAGASSAVAGRDYTAELPAQLEFDAAHRTRQITITPLATSARDVDQVLVLAITAVAGGRVGRIAEHRLVIAASASASASAGTDSDADGLPDAWEQRYFGDLRYGAHDNPDGDDADNRDEFRVGRDPSAGVRHVAPAQVGLKITGALH